MRVSEIRVNQIRVNQGLGVLFFFHKMLQNILQEPCLVAIYFFFLFLKLHKLKLRVLSALRGVSSVPFGIPVRLPVPF